MIRAANVPLPSPPFGGEGLGVSAHSALARLAPSGRGGICKERPVMDCPHLPPENLSPQKGRGGKIAASRAASSSLG